MIQACERRKGGNYGMFGYVTPCKPELRIREWESYRATYCGLCGQLGREYGFVSRMFLNYDLVLVALMADSLAGEMGSVCRCRCIASPVRRHCILQTTGGLRLAAAAMVLLCWYKLEDDRADERGPRALAAGGLRLLLRGAWRKAAAAYPDLDAELAAQTRAQQELEAARAKSPDQAAEPTGRMCAAILGRCAPSPADRPALERLGLFLGKILYWLDAAEDLEADRQRGRYNVFLLQGMSREQAIARAQELCRMAAGEIALCYNLLPWQHSKTILDNIIFLGLAQSISRAGKPSGARSRHPEP